VFINVSAPRIGESTVSELIDELRRFAAASRPTITPMPDLNSEVLDFRAVSESFAPVRLRRSDLQTLRFVTPHQGRERHQPSGAFFFFGEGREQRCPDGIGRVTQGSGARRQLAVRLAQ
jgi:hypothetical protein